MTVRHSVLMLVPALLLGANVALAEVGAARQEQLLHMLKHDCGSCHGMSLRGGLGPPLTSDALINKDDDFLVRTILEGRTGTPMPPFRPLMTEEEAAWLVAALRKGGATAMSRSGQTASFINKR
jgi:cytochrome c55X